METPEQSSEQIEQNTSEQTVGINIEDWSVTSTQMVIDFYKSNSMLWDKTHKDNWNQHKTTKVLGPLVAKFMKASPPRNRGMALEARFYCTWRKKILVRPSGFIGTICPF